MRQKLHINLMYISSKGEQKDPKDMPSSYLLNALLKSQDALAVERVKGIEEESTVHADNVRVLKEEVLRRLSPEEKRI